MCFVGRISTPILFQRLPRVSANRDILTRAPVSQRISITLVDDISFARFTDPCKDYSCSCGSETIYSITCIGNRYTSC